MSEEKKYLIANPNFSAGKDMAVVNAVADSVSGIEGVKLVKVDPEAEFNRTVLTLIGEPEPMTQALIAVASKCAELIDMREHKGDHPRMGALDVVPIFPLRNITIEETVEFTLETGKRIFEATKLPVYFCEGAASSEERKLLTFVRKGQYEGIKQLLLETKDDPERQEEYNARKPDLSTDGLLSETFGAMILEPQEEKAAFFNVFLDTEDVDLAQKIANSIRRAKGGFTTVTAKGTKFEGRKGSVVSLNILDTDITPIYRPFEMIKFEAERYGVRVTGSELVGIVRLDFVVEGFARYLQLENFKPEHIIETCLMQ